MWLLWHMPIYQGKCPGWGGSGVTPRGTGPAPQTALRRCGGIEMGGWPLQQRPMRLGDRQAVGNAAH